MIDDHDVADEGEDDEDGDMVNFAVSDVGAADDGACPARECRGRQVQSWTLPASRMNLSPELTIALQRITACNRSERLLMVVRDDLFKSLQAGQIAVAYAHEAWMQLEQLGADVMSIGRLVGFVDRDKLHKAFKDSKLLMRDRVVWQAMGRFRTILDTQVIMDYLAVIVNSDNTRLSQLRNAYYKVGA